MLLHRAFRTRLLAGTAACVIHTTMSAGSADAATLSQSAGGTVADAQATQSAATGDALATDGASQDATRTDPSSDAPTTTDDEQAGAAAQRGTVEADIVVTGIRQSLDSALSRKRRSDSIVDSIVAEDIGKLPDITVSEALARVTGVQVERSGDRATAVLIRGLAAGATTYNGRNLFTTNSRSLDLAFVPSSLISGLDVYKTTTPDLIEGSIGGSINIRTYRPFDLTGSTLSGTLRFSRNDLSEKDNLSGNILASGRWDTGIGEVGLLLTGSIDDSSYRNTTRFNSINIVPPRPGQIVEPASVGRGFVFPADMGVLNSSGDRNQKSLIGSAQWQATPELDVYVDGLWTQYETVDVNDFINIALTDGGPALTDVVLNPADPTQVATLTKRAGWPGDMFRGVGTGKTTTQQYAAGGKWESDGTTISTDLAYTSSRFEGRYESFDTSPNRVVLMEVDFDRPGDVGGPSFSLLDFDRFDPASYVVRSNLYARSQSKGREWQGRIDLAHEFDSPWLSRIEAGARYSDREASFDDGFRSAWLGDRAIPVADTPVGTSGGGIFKSGFRDGSQGFDRWWAPSASRILSQSDAFHQFVADQLLLDRNGDGRPDRAGDAASYLSSDSIFDPTKHYDAAEKTYSGYAQIKYGAVESLIDGVIGVRVTRTETDLQGFKSEQGVVSPTGRQTGYTDVLPSATIRIKPTDDLQFRGAVGKTRTRPGFNQLNPAVVQVLRDAGNPSRGINRSSGNIDLNPVESINYDITAEYYPSPGNALTLAAFYHDIDGFIDTYETIIRDDPTFGIIYQQRPENGGSGYIKGLEASATTTFDFLPGILSGFGLQASYTRIDSEQDLPRSLGIPDAKGTLPNVSKNNYNLIGFYEKYGLSARLAYNYRSDWINFYSNDPGNPNLAVSGQTTRGVGRLDFSGNYTLSPRVAIVLDLTNILAEPFVTYRSYTAGKAYVRDVRYESRQVAVSLRVKL